MISPPSSPTFTTSRSSSGKFYTENEYPPLSPKRSFAQLDEDQLSQPELKRRDVQPSRRTPLDPLSASALENRRYRGSQSAGAASHHSLVTPFSGHDLRPLLPEQTVSSGSCGMQRSAISDALVCSWPPPIPTPGTATPPHSSPSGQHVSHCRPLHSPEEKMSSRAAFPEPTSTTWNPQDFSQTKTTATMTKPARLTGWKSENVLQPIRSRTNSMPSVRRPPGELWRSDSGLTNTDHAPVGSVEPFVYPTPPGLPPPKPELRRSGSSSSLLSHASVSLYLAHGSQPLRASEQTKAVPPIGAERSQVSITSPKSHTRNFSANPSHDPSTPLWSPSPLQARWKNGTNLSNTTSPEKAQAASADANMSREDLQRLLRHATRNKYAPKIISPLSPLRSSTLPHDPFTDPVYQSRVPPQSKYPSPRYTQCPTRRARTICEGYQSLDWNTMCMHCQECKRDTIGKRLLAFRYRQQQTYHFQRNMLLAYPSRGSTMSATVGDRVALANRIRETFAYEMDDEEKSLWEEVAAVTGASPVSLPRVGMSCAAAAHRQAMDDWTDDGPLDDYPELSDDCSLANESATLLREVIAY